MRNRPSTFNIDCINDYDDSDSFISQITQGLIQVQNMQLFKYKNQRIF